MRERERTRRPASFRLAGSIDVELPEPSDVTALPGGRFLVVSDLERSAAVVEPAGVLVNGASSWEVRRVPLERAADDEESGFEAVAFDPGAGRLFVVSEERHELEIHAYRATDARPRLLAHHALPPLAGAKKKRKKKDRNKGVEGMAWLPAALSPTGAAHLVLAKEARPSALVLLDPDGTGTLREIALDPDIEDACRDFSGLAVDPLTGHLFLCSDESASFAEIELGERDGELRARLVSATELRDPRGRPMERVEGIALDERGDLHVLLENDRTLWRLERE